MLEAQIKRTKGLTTIKTENGAYSLLLSTHLTLIRRKRLPTKFDGLIIETGTPINYIQEPDKTMDLLSKIYTHKGLVTSLARERIPIYLADIHSKHTLFLSAADLLIGLGEIAAAVVFLNHLQQDPNLLKALVGLPLTTWITSPGLTSTLSLGAGIFGRGLNWTTKAFKTSSRIHPEIAPIILGTRNAVFAQKAFRINDHNGRGQHLVIGLGGDHVAIEDRILQSEEERLDYLRETQWLWGRFVTPETLYTIQKWEHRRGRWRLREILEDPKLKTLVS